MDDKQRMDTKTSGASPSGPDGGASLLESLAEASLQPPPPRSRIMARLRNYFLTGLIVAGPVAITLYILWWFVNWIDAWVKPLLPHYYLPEHYIPFTIPGFGLIAGVIGLTIIGAFTANLFGRSLLSYGEYLVGRMPVVRGLYKALKQIFETVLSSSNSFKKVGLIEFPRKGIWSIVFIATDTVGEIRGKVGGGERLVSVFLPTTPNPTTGYLMFLPGSDVIMLDMTVEDAAKMLISGGLIVPEYRDKVQKLAKDAKAKRAVETAKPAKVPEPMME